MPRLQRKSFSTPDEVRTFTHGRIDVIQLDEVAIGRFALQPGWRWSQDVGPVVGTRSCQNQHVGDASAGSLQRNLVTNFRNGTLARSACGPTRRTPRRRSGRRTGRPRA